VSQRHAFGAGESSLSPSASLTCVAPCRAEGVLPPSVAGISGGAVVAPRIAALFLAVRAQAFEQAPERRFVSRQASCPVGVSLSSELIDPGRPLAAFTGAATPATIEGHCPPPSQVPGSYSGQAG
jgi:hypothetical protein